MGRKRAYVICGMLIAGLTCSAVSPAAARAEAAGVYLRETEAKEPETEAKEPETEAKEPETEAKEPETEAKEPETEAKEPETEAKEPETEAKEPETEVKEPETEVQEYLPITTVEELKAMAEKPEETYRLMNDLDLSDAAWSSIPEFSGTLDGNGHTVKGLTAALFDHVTGGSISNLVLSDVHIQGGDCVGGLVNLWDGSEKPCELSGVSISGEVRGSRIAGGLVGTVQAADGQVKVTSCTAAGAVAGTNEVGGLIGRISCGSKDANASVSMAGLANAASVSGTSKIGGIVGAILVEDDANSYDARVFLTESFQVGRIDCISSYSGGMAGYLEITGASAGLGAVNIENCFNQGKMKDGGNIAGELFAASGSISFRKCVGIQLYNSNTKGIFDHMAERAEGMTGYSTLSDCYYYTATGEYAYTSGSGISGTAAACSAAQMKAMSNYTNFDFTNIWTIDGTKNGGYPYLRSAELLEIPYAAPAKGSILKDSSTAGSYKVVTPGLKVTYMGTTDPDAATVTIPAEIEIDGWSYQVTMIAARAFYGNRSLTKVTIPSSVTTINCGAFFRCSSLKTVSGCKGVEKMYKNVFRDCKKLKTVGGTSGRITLPSIVFIGKRVFLNCTSVKKALLSSKDLTTIGSSAFQNCSSMTQMNISSEDLDHIGKQAFYKDTKLKNITLRTSKLTAGQVGTKSFAGIRTNAVYKVPSDQTIAYWSIFTGKGGAEGSVQMKAL